MFRIADCAASSRATTPVTAGHAIDVPSITAKLLRRTTVDTMPTPGPAEIDLRTDVREVGDELVRVGAGRRRERRRRYAVRHQRLAIAERALTATQRSSAPGNDTPGATVVAAGRDRGPSRPRARPRARHAPAGSSGAAGGVGRPAEAQVDADRSRRRRARSIALAMSKFEAFLPLAKTR